MADSTPDPQKRQQCVLTVTVAGRDDRWDLVTLGADELPEDVIAVLEGSSAPLTADVTAWFGHTAEDAMAIALAAVSLHETVPRVQFAVAGVSHARPFEAALAAMPSAADTAGIARGRRVATWLASKLPHPEHEAASSVLASRLRELGIKGVKVQQVLKDIRKDAAGRNSGDCDDAPRRAGEVFDDLPFGAGEFIIPTLYHLRGEGVFRDVPTDDGVAEECVTLTPLLVTGRGRDLATGEMTLKVLWRGRDGWTELEFARRDLFDSRTVTALGAFGPFVDTNNARGVVAYVSAFEAANDHLLDTEVHTSALGWIGGRPELGFALPDRHIVRHGTAPSVRMRRLGGGYDQLLAAVCAGGTFDGWRESISRLGALPAVRFALLAAFAAPLLAVLDVLGFAILLSCPTSRGKTTALKLCAAVWGRPHEEVPTLVHALHCTRAWVERAAGLLGCVPLILDDTMKLAGPEVFGQMIYDFDGGGKRRATKSGLDRSTSFRTVVLLSGESGLSDFTQAGGARSRVLQVRMAPFGAENAENASLAQEMVAAAETHYGHAGPRWVEWIVARENEWGLWRSRLEDIRRVFSVGVTGGPSFRVARHLAALRLADELLSEAGLLPFVDGRDVVAELLPMALAGAAEADRAAAALQLAVEHAVSHPSLYLAAGDGARQVAIAAPHGGFCGRWSPGRTDWGLAFVPSQLREILFAAGFPYDAALEAWKSKGWLISDGDRQGLKKVRFGEANLRCVALSCRAVEPLVGKGVDPSPAP